MSPCWILLTVLLAPAWRQAPAAEAKYDPRVLPVAGMVEAADSLPALEVFREATEEGERVRVQVLRVRETPGRVLRVLYLGSRVFTAEEEVCHLGYRVPSGQIALGEVLERTGRRWNGPAAEDVLFRADFLVLGEPEGLGGLLCCPPQPREAYAPRIFRIQTGGTELRCTGSEPGGVRTVSCSDAEGNGGSAECWRCLETTGSGSCGAILSSGFVPEE